MVFFTCNICGESVKKPAVEKHYQTRCRGNQKNVSCMDCLKDFYGEDYVAHTKCISEAQKYASQNGSFSAKEPRNKNAQKQESWMDIIRAILDSSEYKLTGPVRSAFQKLQSVDNVPRKKAKFENFVANCIKIPRQQAAQVWDILEKEMNKMKEAKQAELAREKAEKEQQKKEAEQEAPAKKKAEKKHQKKDAGEEAPPKKKAKVEVPEDAAAEESTNGISNDFDWPAQLTKLVAKEADGIFVEKLRKKLLKKYTKHLSVEDLTEKQAKKFQKRFDKQLKLADSLQVDGDVVKIAS
ncbi:cell growth-regulating nucleolar protein [Drosophila biarmipes]|uniref:cell growth-regulating nucleolar protein n=1 Tax=Drosophila biarmipes TaxID=125945 RepID=UPI0007E72438|nr:cell growth-regulating nucleolar protein [Drosophila biarmipes]